MRVVRIDRSTIKRNPTAGQTTAYLQGPIECSFEIKSRNIPDWIQEPLFIIEAWKEKDGIVVEANGKINGPIDDDLQKKIQKCEGLTVTIKSEPIVIDSLMPEPDYLFEYVETYMKCKHCKNKVEVQDIESDYIGDERFELCPICGAEFSFPERRFEDIKDVPKKYKK